MRKKNKLFNIGRRQMIFAGWDSGEKKKLKGRGLYGLESGGYSSL